MFNAPFINVQIYALEINVTVAAFSKAFSTENSDCLELATIDYINRRAGILTATRPVRGMNSNEDIYWPEPKLQLSIL